MGRRIEQPKAEATPQAHIKREANNFVSLMLVTHLHENPASCGDALEKWFWNRYDELIAAALA